MKFRSNNGEAVVTFLGHDGRELFRARTRRPRTGELIATCDRVFEVLGGKGEKIKVRAW